MASSVSDSKEQLDCDSETAKGWQRNEVWKKIMITLIFSLFLPIYDNYDTARQNVDDDAIAYCIFFSKLEK